MRTYISPGCDPTVSKTVDKQLYLNNNWYNSSLMVLLKIVFNNLDWSHWNPKLFCSGAFSQKFIFNSDHFWPNSHLFNFSIQKNNIIHKSQTHRPRAVESCRNQTRKVSWEKSLQSRYVFQNLERFPGKVIAIKIL